MEENKEQNIDYEDDEKNLESKYESLQKEIKNLRLKISQIVSDNTNNKKYGNFLSTKSKNKNNNNNNGDGNNAINATFRCRRKLEGHFGKIYSLHWAFPNSASNYSDIVSASQDGKLLIWNTETTNKKLAINLKSSWVMTCCYSYNNQFVASGGLDSTCSIYDITKIPEGGWHNDKPFRELCQHEGYLSTCKFIGDSQNNQIITSSGDGTCILWDIVKNKSIQQFNNNKNNNDNDGDIECLDINQNKSIFVCGSIDSVAKIFDYRQDNNNKCIATFRGQHNGEDINCIKFFPDGNSFISGSDDHKLKLFDLKSFKLINTYYNSEIKSSCISCDFSNSGYYIISGYDDQDPFCVIWNTLTGLKEKELQHGSKVPAIQTSSNGYAVATGCWDRIIRIWA